MEAKENKIQERNREIGEVLRETRLERNVPLAACANLVGTSRRRYMAMEQGETTIGLAELEVLMAFLQVPVQKIWHDRDTLIVPRQVVVEALPGERLQIVVDIRNAVTPSDTFTNFPSSIPEH